MAPTILIYVFSFCLIFDKINNMHEAKFYKKLDNNNVQCQLCSHFCVIQDNNIGICRTRKNTGGKLYTLVYGYPIALNVDPIEKKPLFHFMPGSFTYSLGTLGCNFRCANCQNWDISQAASIENKTQSMDFIEPKKIIEEAINNRCKSISYTYTEPTIFTEYALDIMKLARKHNLKNIWISNGFMSEECLDAILPYLDAINIDLKSMDDDFYRDNCGARIQPVLDNIKAIKKSGAHLEITTLIIPTLSDSPEMLKRAAEFIALELDSNVPWHVSKFSANISWKLKNLPDTSKNLIYQGYEIGKNASLKYVYAGNIPGNKKENTYCPKCGELAISRFGYNIERLDNKGKCANCGNDLCITE